jgi:transposase
MVHSTEDRQLFTSKVVQNISLKDIQRDYLPHVTLRTLSTWRNRLVGEGHLVPKKASGRPKKHSDREIRFVKRTAAQNPGLSIKRLQVVSGIEACHQTMVKILKEHYLQSFKAIKKPLLTQRHVEMRLRWANEHLNFSVEDWKRWSFSDESSVELDCSEGIKRFIIERSQRLEPEFIQRNRQMGGGKIMVWSYIHWNGIGPLIFIRGGINGHKYKEILNRNVLPHLLEQMDENGDVQYYQDDGASAHDCEEVIEFCAAKGIQRPYWPPNSPDMNPIEHVWGWIKHKLSNLDVLPNNIEELKTAIQEIWGTIDQESIRKLYRGMPNRIKVLHEKQGKNTKF